MSGVAQARVLRDGLVSAAELRAVAVETIERLNPVLNAVVIPLFDRPGDGVPMLLKDAGPELADTPHWVGVAALRDAQNTSLTTTELAHKFERAGFSIVGKDARPQLSNGATTEPARFAPTRNPWDVTRSVGGSSGGPAAEVASGMVAVAHGSDATGSLRCPAALCGVATRNPTAGRIQGVPPAGRPPNDAWRDFVLARHSEVLSAGFAALTGASAAASACVAGVHVAGALLEALGHDVEISWPDALDHLWSESAAPFVIARDATRSPIIRWVSQRLGRRVQRGELDNDVFEAADRDAARDPSDVRAAQAAIEVAATPIADWWDDHDLLVTPTTFQPAWPLGGNPGPKEMGTLLAPFSLTGQPALSLPLHQTDDGLPVGVQLVARHGADEILLRLAHQLQSATDWTTRRPHL